MYPFPAWMIYSDCYYKGSDSQQRKRIAMFCYFENDVTLNFHMERIIKVLSIFRYQGNDSEDSIQSKWSVTSYFSGLWWSVIIQGHKSNEIIKFEDRIQLIGWCVYPCVLTLRCLVGLVHVILMHSLANSCILILMNLVREF